MASNYEHDGEDELQAARRTAYGLGQTEGAEQAEVAAELAASPQARQEVEAVEALAARLKAAARETPPPEPSPALREAVQRRLAELEPAAGPATAPDSAHPWWRSRLAALALTAACLAAVAVPIMWSMHLLGTGKEREVAMQMTEASEAAPKITERKLSSKKPQPLPGKFDVDETKDTKPTEMVMGMSYDPTLLKPGSGTNRIDESLVGHLGGGDTRGSMPPPPASLSAGSGPMPAPSLTVPNPQGTGAGVGERARMYAPTRRHASSTGSALYSDVVTMHDSSGAGSGDGRSSGPGPASGAPVTNSPGVGGRGTGFGAAGGIFDGVTSVGGLSEDGGQDGTEGQAGHSESENNNRFLASEGHLFTADLQVPGFRASNPIPDDPPITYPDAKVWEDLTTRRKEKTSSMDLSRASPAEKKIQEALKKPTQIEFVETPLKDVIDYLKDLHHIEIQIDSAALKAAGVDESTPVTKNLKGISLRSALKNLLDELQLKYVIHNDELLITSLAKAERYAAKKPLETWKSAHVVPNTSRLMVGENEELPLKGMQVDVRVDGFRARVLIDLYYFNDRGQQLEGNFQLRLPDEASPYFFAFGRTVYQAPQVTTGDSMFFKPQQVSQGDTSPERILSLRGDTWQQPKVARMVPKEKAALAYRDTVRRRVDPALVEWSGAGVFQCRVFPLAPQSLHRVTIGYDVDLLCVGDDLELRLDLPGQAPGTIVDLNIAASDARQVALTPGPSPSGRGETLAPTASADGQRLSYRLIDPQQRPLVVRLRKPGTQMLTGADEATGSYFATRVGLTLPETPAANRAQRAIFLVDTSLSAGPQFSLWTKLLRATLENNRDSIREFAVVFFNVETFWWQEKFVANTPENVEALLSYADGLALEGATDLGRALKEAASPAWLKKAAGPAPDLFLLSDGAATWGEDRWALLAKALTPGPSPILLGTAGGRGENTGSLFAYRTGLAGGDPRLLTYLAEQTGGAVFSLVGEAEIASASVAHRNRPWRLTGIEMAGGNDLLVAGRPQYVFPGQRLLVVGRLEPNRTDRSDRSEQQLLVFTLQQGNATQTISVKMEQVLTSELAARTFGQVATSQLEDACSAAAAAEPVATAYARHFRVTGRTCSLLMLDTEQDYARFNIKPEEDSFVVKDRPAGPIVAKTLAEVTAAMGDPKANFLAWYRRLRETSEVHFDLPASLDVALDGLPAETFAVTAPPLQCKLRLRKDLPENLRQPWQSGLPEYETLAAEAQRRLAAYGADDALRGLSSLVEDRPGDAALARDLAFSAIAWQRPGEAYHLLRRAGAARTFEPITFHAMAHCLEQMGRADLAIVYYELACGGQWDARFGDIHNIAQLDYLRFLRRVTDGHEKAALADYAKARMATLAATQLRDTADVAVLIFWNTDGTDVDLHVIEPNGEECFYQHTQTASGGHISRDVTTGYGPELYLLPKAPAGNYRISAHYYATDANRASTRTKVLALIYDGWGTKDEKATVKALALTGQNERHELGTVEK